jgi:hypothetical protein
VPDGVSIEHPRASAQAQQDQDDTTSIGHFLSWISPLSLQHRLMR